MSLAVLVGAALGSHLYANPGSSPPADLKAAAPSMAAEALTPQQMQSRAEMLQARISSHVAHGRQLLVAARMDKDQLKVGCVNQGVFINERLLEVSSDAVNSLRTAVRSGNRSQQVANYTRVAQAAVECDEAVTGIGSCAGAKDVPVVDTEKVIVKKPKLIDDPTDDCNNLGLGNCANQPLEYVAFSSPFLPD